MTTTDDRSAVYRLYDGQGALLYVGSSNRPQGRLTYHKSSKPWGESISRSAVEWYESRSAALAAEATAIHAEHPLHNGAIPPEPEPQGSAITHYAPEPVYRQLARILRADIASGKYPPNTMIPSITKLAAEHHLAEMTVRKVIGMLVDEGLLVTVPGRGTFVAERER